MVKCILTTSPDWSFNNSGEPDQNTHHTDKFTTETQTHVNLKRKHYAIEILPPNTHTHTLTRALIQNTHACTPTHLWLFTSALAASADTSPFSMFCVGVGRRQWVRGDRLDNLLIWRCETAATRLAITTSQK